MKLRSLLLSFALSLHHLVLAQIVNPPGFISLDCGLSEINGYHNSVTGLPYTSDEGFIGAGESRRISPEWATDSVPPEFLNVRSFPNGSRNCYTLRPLNGKGSQILLRVGFMYGNYDNLNKLPQFDLQLGVDHWDTLTFHNSLSPVHVEIIHALKSEYLHICLLNTGRGTPFISVLELRPLHPPIYDTSLGSLHLIARWDMGPTASTVRYKEGDAYDRIWSEGHLENMKPLLSRSTGNGSSLIGNKLKVPFAVMATAAEATTINHSLLVSMPAKGGNGVYFYLHFAQLMTVQNQSREMNIYLDGHLLSKYRPRYLCVDTFYAVSARSNAYYHLQINATTNSSLPPFLSAAEFYTLRQFMNYQTNNTQVAAIISIKREYGIRKNWQGDPCSPPSFAWIGITCSYNHSHPPNIISLNLSACGLLGTIAAAISNLTMLQSLDLSHNNLTGEVPDFLHRLPSLRYLDLSYNNLKGEIYRFQPPLPSTLRYSYLEEDVLSISVPPESSAAAPAPQKSRNDISFGAPSPTINDEKKKKKKANIVIPIAASIAAFVGVVIVSAMFYIFIWRKRESRSSSSGGSLIEPMLKQYRFSEVESMIGARTVIGEGGFGIVYRGLMNGGIPVAVKILKVSAQLEITKDLKSEVNILARIRHRNLVRIHGYCNEGMHRAIIFELLENGSLNKHLSESSPRVLSWELRLSILSGAAQGLEYMHHGCPEPIVHRDIKPENILLTDTFEAKLADFGLSRIFPAQITREVGTPGYYNDEYSEAGMLTGKVDVYSFGVVILVVVTGQAAISEGTHITQRIAAKIRNGDIRGIVDPRLQGNYDVNVAWKMVELGMACVSNISSRPDMHHVVRQLKESCATATQGPSNYVDLRSVTAPATR